MKRIIVLGLLLFMLLNIAASPNPQDTPPNTDNLFVYGVPWVMVSVVVIGSLRRWAGINQETSAIVSGVLAVVGYLVVQNLPDVEKLLPWLPTYLPQVLWAIILFGAQLGLVPGETAKRVYFRLTK